MKNLVKIMVITVFVLSLTSCKLLSKAEAKAGYDYIMKNLHNSVSNQTNGNPTDTDAVKSTSTKSNEVIVSDSNESGVYVGLAFTDIPLSNKLKLQPEINFIGVKDFNQIQTPILLKYKISDKFNLYTGPSFEFLLDAPQNIKSFNFALDFGVSYDILNNFLIEARYDWGQSNLLEGGNSDNSFKINHFQIGFAYKFGSKK